MKKTLFILFFFAIAFSFAQKKSITLEEAITIAQKKSPDYERLLNTNQRSYWRFRNYEAGFLPQLRFDGTLPRYSNSVNRLTNDEGQDIFVRSNQSSYEGTLSLNQNLPLTGGTFSLASNLERIDVFGNNNGTNYFVTPFSIRYNQNSLFYNEFKWDKKIEPLLYEEAKRDFIESMEDISLKAARRYFALLKAQIQNKISSQNLSNQDTLFAISKGRFKIGKIAENDLLQIELALLNSKNNLVTNEITLKQSAQNLARFLELPTEDLELFIPDDLELFDVTVEKALEEAQSNRKEVIAFRRRRLEAEQNLAEVKGNNRLQLGVRANFGISQDGDNFNNLFMNYNQQQSVSIQIGIPLIDWGVSKSRRKLVQADLDLVNNNIDQQKEAFEQEILLHTLNWQNQRNFLETAKKAKEIATKRFEITKKRFILGKITITDLNLALQEKDRSVLTYLNSLEKFWIDYYTLRKLTLYDFKEQKKIEVEDIIYD
jgi:outer membrane protein TolC